MSNAVPPLLAALVDDVTLDQAAETFRPGTPTGPAPQITRAELPAVRGDHGMLRRLMAPGAE